MAETAAAATGIRSPEPCCHQSGQTGVFALLAAMTMLFAAFTSAYVVRRGLTDTWTPLYIPQVLNVSVIVQVAGSVGVQLARRMSKRRDRGVFLVCCAGAFALGIVFVLTQMYAWREIAAADRTRPFSPSAGFFYVFSVTYVAFVIGGLGVILRMFRRMTSTWSSERATNQLQAICYYWHYLSAVWIYMMCLLRD